MYNLSFLQFLAMVATVFVSAEGVYLAEGDYVVRELSVYYCETGEIRHYTFDPPQRFLTGEEVRTNYYVRNVLDGVGVFDVIPGAMSSSASQDIVTALGNYQILCVGNVAYAWLKTILPCGNVVNIQSRTDFTYPKNIPEMCCGVQHNSRYCALSKLWVVVFYFMFSDKASIFNFTM